MSTGCGFWVKGTRTGVPGYPWRTCTHGIYMYLLYFVGILVDCFTHKYPLYRDYIGISHKGAHAGIGVHPFLSPDWSLVHRVDRKNPVWHGEYCHLPDLSVFEWRKLSFFEWLVFLGMIWLVTPFSNSGDVSVTLTGSWPKSRIRHKYQ